MVSVVLVSITLSTVTTVDYSYHGIDTFSGYSRRPFERSADTKAIFREYSILFLSLTHNDHLSLTQSATGTGLSGQETSTKAHSLMEMKHPSPAMVNTRRAKFI